MREGEREPTRFDSCLSYLNRIPLAKLRESYKTVNPVEMEYYTEDDEYYLTSDGNHRTLTAMLVGAEYISANITPLYCDFEKRDRCIAVDKFYEKFNIVQIKNNQCGVEITFRDEEGSYVVDGFSKRKNENCYEYIDKLSDEINADIKIVKIWSKIPKKCVQLLNILCNNKRIIQYIEKAQDKSFHWKEIVHIYDYD